MSDADRPNVAPMTPGTQPIGAPLIAGVVSELPSGVGFKEVEVKDAAEAAAAIKQANEESSSLNLPKDFAVQFKPPVPIEQLEPEKREQILADIQKTIQSVAAQGVTVPKEMLKILPSATSEKPVEPSSTTDGLKGICPNCGWDQSRKDVIEVTEDDKQMWLRHILGGDRFRKSYKLYGGQIEVVMRSRRVSERQMIENAVDAVRAAGKITTINNIIYWTSRYGLVVSLDLLRTLDGTTRGFNEIVSETGSRAYSGMARHTTDSDLDVAQRSVFDSMGDGLYSSLLDCYIRFDLLCARLQLLSRQEDFFVAKSGGQ